MNIGIIDAEIINKKKHRFPNLCCMKISAYHKSLGDNVELVLDYDNIGLYDKIYISKVFIKTDIPYERTDMIKTEDNCIEFYRDHPILNEPHVEYGGTGFFYDKAPPLPYEIEHIMPDYHLYDDWVEYMIMLGARKDSFKVYNDYSIGFLTRGCFRGCKFCINRNYKKCIEHSPLNEFYDPTRKKIYLLDDNFLSHPDWRKLIEPVKATKKKFAFKQGLDERLLTDEKVKEILSWNYDGDIIFAFDNIADKDLIIKKADIIKKYSTHIKGDKFKFYVFTGYDRNGIYDDTFWEQDIIDLLERCKILKEYRFKPYIMRHENYENSPYRGTYINIAQWANQPHIFFTHTYKEACEKDDTRKGGDHKSATWRYYEQAKHITEVIDV